MADLWPFAVLPLVFVGLITVQLWKRMLGPALTGLLAFVLVIGIGTWSILQSRSSTAGIGFLFLPPYAAIAGALANGAAILRSRPGIVRQISGWVGLLLSIAMAANLAVAGFKDIAKNRARDALYNGARP